MENSIEEKNKVEWIDYKLNPPKIKDLNIIEISYDGAHADNTVEWMDRRTCMLAGTSGGNGYFGAGWGTNGINGCDYGLICDDPTHWRIKS